MGTLENESLIQSLDSENMLQSIMDLPDQVAASWREFNQFVLPTHYIQASSVLLIGMGASYHAALIAANMAGLQSRIPIVVAQQTSLPNYISNTTLVIAISYSGQTPEVVQMFEAAAKRGAKLLAISTGGELAALCRKYRSPHYHIRYGAQPRAAFGYLLTPIIAALHRLGFIEFDQASEMDDITQGLRELITAYAPARSTSHNIAKGLAQQLHGSQPLLIASPLLSGVAARWVSQLAQNAKMFASFAVVPEFTHTAISGLDFPAQLKETLYLITLRSAQDDDVVAAHHNSLVAHARREKLRIEEVVAQSGKSLLYNLYGLSLLGDCVSFYLALLNGVDPSATPRTMDIKRSFQSELVNAG